ncbi:MAG TPA: hypothetical protein VG267_11275 [Terracidiphilus sp.]|jgi:hypothetical protein|nr:hypothetical protein [Terracidiphilus sp.]
MNTYVCKLAIAVSWGILLSAASAQTSILTSPANGATVSPLTQFSWTSVSGATDYVLWVGTTPNAQDALFYNASTGTSTSATLQPATTYYTTLFTFIGSNNTVFRSSFQTAATAVLTKPANGSTSLDSGQPIAFGWTAIPGVTSYELMVGTSVGAKDTFDSGAITTSSTSATLNPNTSYYARLITTVSGTASYTDTVFSTGYPLAHLTYPLNGATNVSQFQPFTWNRAAGATGYFLAVSPTGYGTPDFYVSAGSALIPTVTSQYVPALQPETTYYVELCTNNPGSNGGTCVKTSFTTGAGAPLPPDRTVFYQQVMSLTAQVRLMTEGTSDIPTPGMALNNEMLSYGGIPALSAKCGDFTVTLLNLFTQNGILARNRGLSSDGMDTHVVAEYWDPFNQHWQVADSYFGVVYFNLQTQTGQSADDINSLLLSGKISSIEPLFLTSNGALYTTSYFMDPMLFYINPQPFGLIPGQAELNYVPNSPLPFMNPASSSAIGTAGLYIFNFANQTDSVQVQNGPSTIVISPSNTEGFATSMFLVPGWTILSPIPPGMTMYTYQQVYNYSNPNIYIVPVTSTTPLLVTPGKGAIVEPQQIQFYWATVPGATNYTLWIGTTPGAKDALYYTTAHLSNPAGVTSTTATLLPGATYYATMFAQTANGNKSTASTFQTVQVAYLLAPAAGATVSPVTQFNWTNVPGATSYILWVGTTPDAKDALYYNAGTGTSTSAALLPSTNYYTTLYTFVGSNYTVSRSSFQTAATAYLTSPATGSTVAPQTQFSWTSVPQAVSYTLWVGSTPNAKDVLYYTTAHSANPAGITSSSATLPPGMTYYTTLFTQTATASTHSTSSFQTSATSYLITPAAGATVSTTAQFSWVSVTGATNYVLWVGTAPNSQDVLFDNAGTATGTSATLQPGITYYTTLFTFVGSNYTVSRSSFQTAATAYLTSPTVGSTVAPQTQFSWTSVPQAVNYTLWVGSTPNAKDVLYYTTAHSANPAGITSTSATLPPGKTCYTTLFTQTATASTYSTSSFQTAATSYLIAPATGATVSTMTQFSWVSVPGATNYVLWVGTAPNGKNALYDNAGTVTGTSATLQPGTTYYTTLFTFVGSNNTVSRSSFQTAATAYLTSPAAGSTVAPQTQFNWTSVPQAVNYTLWVGSTPNAKDVLYFTTAHSGNPAGITSTSATLQPGMTYYTTLFTQTATASTHSTSSFQTSATSNLIAPAAGATVSPLIQFSWTSVPVATDYVLWVGTKPNTKDALFYNAGTGTGTSATLQPATTYYTTLFTFVGSNNTITQSSFLVAATAVLSKPANGATNLDSGQPIAFSWTAIPGVTSYELMVGTSVGAKNSFDSGAITTSSLSATLNPNTTYYARLITKVNGTSAQTDSSFSTGYPLARLTYPLNSATGISQFLPFTWNQVQGAEKYKLTVSLTGYGVADFFDGIQDMIATDTSEYVWALQPNATYYARLCTLNPGPAGGGCVNSSFTTGNEPPQPTNANAFYQSVQSLTAQVREMTQNFSDVPTPGSYLYQMVANHAGDPTQNVACGWFAAALLDQFTMNGILARQRNISLHGTDGHVLTEYWDPFNQKWELADPTFGAVYFDPDTQLGQGAEDVNALLLAGNYSAINPLFVSPYGSQWMTHYHLDPITMYNEVDPFGMLDATDEVNYLPNSPLPFLNSVPLSTIGTAGQYVFLFANSTDSITAQDGSGNHVISPANNEGWASSVYLNTGWSILGGVPDGMQMYTFKRVLF